MIHSNKVKDKNKMILKNLNLVIDQTLNLSHKNHNHIVIY